MNRRIIQATLLLGVGTAAVTLFALRWGSTPTKPPHHAAAVVAPGAPAPPLSRLAGANPIATKSARTSKSMRSSLKAVAAAYASNMKYPPWSTPLTSRQWTLLHPNAYIPIALPLRLAGGTLHIALALPHTTLFADQPITVTATVRAPKHLLDTISSAEAGILDLRGRRLDQFRLNEKPARGGILIFSGSLPADSSRNWPRNLRAEVEISVSSRKIKVVAPFRYEYPQAILTGLDSSYVDGPNLVIPLEFNVIHPGYYRVQANLVRAGNNQPIAHLTTEGTLDTLGDGLALRCHASVLRTLHAPGPYRLTGFLIERLADHPGKPTLLGRSAAESYPVEAHPLAAYATTPYRSPIEQSRLQFLRRLAGESPQ